MFGVEGMQVGMLHVLPGIPGDRRTGAAAAVTAGHQERHGAVLPAAVR